MPWYVCLLEVRGQPKAVCFFLLHVFWGFNSKVKCLYLLLGIFSADFFFFLMCVGFCLHVCLYVIQCLRGQEEV